MVSVSLQTKNIILYNFCIKKWYRCFDLHGRLWRRRCLMNFSKCCCWQQVNANLSLSRHFLWYLLRIYLLVSHSLAPGLLIQGMIDLYVLTHPLRTCRNCMNSLDILYNLHPLRTECPAKFRFLNLCVYAILSIVDSLHPVPIFWSRYWRKRCVSGRSLLPRQALWTLSDYCLWSVCLKCSNERQK